GPEDVGSDLKTKTKRALKCILEKTLHLDALEPLLQQATPSNILKYVIGQFAKILPHDVAARRTFVTSGGLQRLQEIAASFGAGVNQIQQIGGSAVNVIPNGLTGTKMGEYIRTINECYPEEIVRYYSPGYSATLLEKIDDFSRIQEVNLSSVTGASQVPKLPVPADIPAALPQGVPV
ncbi:Sperm-associated antigen 6, partial [Irineochytrium annulatum]